jgi:hypothetical protein
MSEDLGPYGEDTCFFCKKKPDEDHPERIAGYQKSDKSGVLRDACQECVKED